MDASGWLMMIKPSGVSYDDLTPDSMVVCDLDGKPVSPGSLSPSSDTATHAYIYRHMPEVGGVVHTHSTYATAWAARGEAIPCVITAMADEFGGEIPIGPFALIDAVAEVIGFEDRNFDIDLRLSVTERTDHARMQVAYGQFRPASGLRKCLNRWLTVGGPHHEVMNPGPPHR